MFRYLYAKTHSLSLSHVFQKTVKMSQFLKISAHVKLSAIHLAQLISSSPPPAVYAPIRQKSKHRVILLRSHPWNPAVITHRKQSIEVNTTADWSRRQVRKL
jgi:hypothetical protein